MRVTMSNVKGRSETHNLGRLNLYGRPCGSGKSALADSIRFGLLRHVPLLGKRPQDSAQLMSDRTMRVDISLDDDRSFWQSIERTDKGGLTVDAGCSWLEKADATAAGEEIRKLVGVDTIAAAECLDIRELLKATANERAARIEALLQAGEKTPNQIARSIIEWTARILTGHEKGEIGDYRMLIRPQGEGGAGLIPEPQYQELTAASKTLLEHVKGAGIPGATSWANDEKNAANRDHVQKTKAEKELRERLQSLPKPNPPRVVELESERSKLEQQIGAIKERNAAPERKREEMREAGTALTFARSHLEATCEERDAFESLGAKELQTKRARLAVIAQEEIADAPAAVETVNMESLEAEAVALEERGRQNVIPIVPGVEGLEDEAESIARQLNAAQDSPWSAVGTLADEIMQAVNRGGKGRPSMVADVELRIAKLKEIVTAGVGGACISDLEERLELARRAVSERRREIETKTVARDAAVRRGADLREEAAKIRKRIQEQRAFEQPARDKTRKEYEARVKTRATDRSALVPAIAAIEQRDTRTAQALNTAKTKLAEAEKRAAHLGCDAPDLEDVTGIQSTLDLVRVELANLTSTAAKHAELASIVREIEIAGSRTVVFRAIEEACKRVRAQEVTEAGGPLVAHMKRFLIGAGRSETPYFVASKNVCDIGWKRGEHPIAVAVLSGGEWCLFAAALTSAVIALRKAELRFLLIEAGETDAHILSQLLAGIEAIAEDLTMALVCVQRECDVEGWQRVEPMSAADTVADQAA